MSENAHFGGSTPRRAREIGRSRVPLVLRALDWEMEIDILPLRTLCAMTRYVMFCKLSTKSLQNNIFLAQVNRPLLGRLSDGFVRLVPCG